MRQLFEHDRSAFGIVVGKRRCRLEHRHFGAEAPMRLRELKPDRTGPDDDEMFGTTLQLVDRLVGEIRRLGKTRYRRRCRGRGWRAHETPRLDLKSVAD